MKLVDDGYFVVDIGEGDGAFEKRLDLWEIHSRLFELARQFQGKPNHEYLAGVQGLMTDLGLPPCSQRLANQFVLGVNARMLELKNDGGASRKPDSPPATEPPSSAPTPPAPTS